MTSSRRNSSAVHQSPRHRPSHTNLKPTIKRQPSDHTRNIATKTLHHNCLADDLTVPLFPLSSPINQANTHPTFQGLVTCTAIVAWSIYQPTITTAVLATPTQLAALASWAWTVPACPTMCFASLYAAALWATFGTTTTAQFVRGCATEA